MAGRLTQVLANLAAAQKQISSLSGLPAEALPIQSASATAIGTATTQTRSLQQAVSAFVQYSTPQLTQIESMLQEKQPVATIEAAVAPVQHAAAALATSIKGLSSAIDTVSSEVLGYLGQLVPIENNLSNQLTTLNGQLITAQAEEEAKKKDYYWLIALGPFGLIGLAIALPLYFKIKGEVGNYETQIGTLNAEISHLNAMKSACQFMGGEMQDLVSKVSGLKNASDFIADKTLSISSDLDPSKIPVVIDLMVRTAQAEIKTLGMDAA